ncbi:MAG: hypothetical protein ACD_2C00088G0027 [uncultured bacterium (gcode 4)]|uniref:GTPase Obg n=1 Tax=uncultured bacterium (gcode 4) TaxID=1234023 RepID=K2G6B7_9BACT|nr:MAG: hypothetical protein ACD_2C00088G0027 [uncultured bacterium (gcode 4)]
MFIDEVKVTFIAWKGWEWCISWRREKCIPNGWPYGWNGWKWWDIILRANPNENTLWEFRHKKVIKAEIGIKWDTQELAWAMWSDKIIEVPVWTLIKDEEMNLIYDLSTPWESYVLCRWGRWGYGNAHFASSTRQAPSFAELWDVGEQKTVNLELKLVADIGIIGMPNAGKSTLIKSITNVKPKIADYPFTTIIPNLWVLEHKWKSLVLEDVPWLIEWASEWKWLGHSFLKHIERTEVILHLLDLNGLDDIVGNYKTIRNELEKYSENLANKEEILVLSKADLFDDEMIDYIKKDLKAKLKHTWDIFVISAPAFKWTEELKDFLIDKYAHKVAVEEAPEESQKMKIYDLKDARDVNSYKITDLWDMKFEVIGERIEQIARMTNMQNFEATMRVYDVMKKVSIIKKIEHILNTTYKEQTQLRYFEWEDSTEDIIPKVYIAWRCFPLDRVLFWN